MMMKLVQADTKPRHGYYLTVGQTGDGRTLAICSDGTPQLGHDPVTVLTLTEVKSETEAREWFKRVKKEKPWISRH